MYRCREISRIIMFIQWLMVAFLMTGFAVAKEESISKEAIVKIYTVSKKPNYLEPWSAHVQSSTGSGAIIKDGMILTNAHVVANHTFIEVQRYGERKRYVAKVYAVSHQVDLALLKVEDERFFEGVKPLELGGLPQVEQQITVYGFPMGGSTLSATTGVVSRIEHNTYAHSGELFLSIQVDAAVNPGNSGGPAISGGKIVGVVMQVINRSQNIGYLVPTVNVKHFIEDMKDGRYDGFADLGLTTQKLENPTLRKFYGLEESVTGKLVNKISQRSSAYGILKEGDVIVSINGHNIEDDGTVAFRENEFTHYHHIVDAYQMGESVMFDILREGKAKKVRVPLEYKADDLYLVETIRYDEMPNYFIYGGYVFSPLTRNLIQATNRNRLELNYLTIKRKTDKKKEAVVLLKVLASDLTRGYNELGMWIVEKINGETFQDFRDFYEKMQATKETYVVLEDKDGMQVIIDTKKAQAQQKDIMKRYNIEFDVSQELLAKP